MVKMIEVVGHQVKRTAGVMTTLAVLGVFVFIGWSIYAGMIKPVVNPEKTMEQHANQIINPTYETSVNFGGCANIRAMQYKKDRK